MGNFENWKWYSISAVNVDDFDNPKIDRYGKEYVRIKMPLIMEPYAWINWNKKYVKASDFSEKSKYVRIGVNTEATYFMKNPDGEFKKCLGSELLEYMTGLEKEAAIMKEKNTKLYEQNRKILNNENEAIKNE